MKYTQSIYGGQEADVPASWKMKGMEMPPCSGWVDSKAALVIIPVIFQAAGVSAVLAGRT